MVSKLRKLGNEVWYRNIIGMMFGTVIVQSIPIIASLLITRLYFPADFGEFSAWLAYASVMGVFYSLRYEAALVVVDDGEARVVGLLAIFFAIVLCTLLTFLLFFILVSWVHFDIPITNFMLLPFAAFGISLNVAVQAKAAADGQYKKLILMRAIQVLSIAALQILFGIFLSNSFSLSIAFLTGNLISSLIWIIPFLLRISTTVDVINKVKKFFSVNKKFALVGLPAALINTVAAQLPLIIILARFGEAQAGYFALTMKVMGAPITLVGKAVLDVFRRTAAQGFREKGQFRHEYIRTFKLLMVSSCILVIGTIFFAKSIFILAFGDGWVKSGELAVLLLPLFAMRFVASPLSYVIYIVQKQHVDLIWQTLLLLSTIVLLSIFKTLENTLIWYSCNYAVLYLLYLLISYKYSKGVQV